MDSDRLEDRRSHGSPERIPGKLALAGLALCKRSDVLNVLWSAGNKIVSNIVGSYPIDWHHFRLFHNLPLFSVKFDCYPTR